MFFPLTCGKLLIFFLSSFTFLQDMTQLTGSKQYFQKDLIAKVFTRVFYNQSVSYQHTICCIIIRLKIAYDLGLCLWSIVCMNLIVVWNYAEAFSSELINFLSCVYAARLLRGFVGDGTPNHSVIKQVWKRHLSLVGWDFTAEATLSPRNEQTCM